MLPQQCNSAAVVTACCQLESWITQNGWTSYDCFDSGNSPLAHVLLRLNPFCVRLLIQAVKRSPINLRPLLGIGKTVSAKSVGLLASSYAKLSRICDEPRYEDEARRALDWLVANRLPGYSGACWGYPFDVYVRSMVYLAGTPTVVATSFIAQAFVDAYEELGDMTYLLVARSACDFLLQDLVAITDGDAICIPYHAASAVRVHNANLLGVALLSRVYRHTGEQELSDYAQRALRYTLARQRADGAWYYGEHPNLRWVDGFHTGFVLDAVHYYIESTGDDEPLPALQRGLDYYQRHFFLEDGTPKYTDRSLYPIDVRCAAQAIQTFSLLADRDPQGLNLACKVAHWTIKHMQDPSGYFYYQITRFFVNKIPYLRWSQGPMLYALANLLARQLHEIATTT